MAKNPATPPIIDTKKLTGAEPDPRGDNRPGVLPDPAQDGINPVTNLREDLVEADGVTPKPVADTPPGPLHPAPGDVPKPASDKAPKGRKIRMRAVADIWPRTLPKDWPEGQEYRIKAGEEVDLPEEEAMDRMESGTAVRADRRA